MIEDNIDEDEYILDEIEDDDYNSFRDQLFQDIEDFNGDEYEE